MGIARRLLKCAAALLLAAAPLSALAAEAARSEASWYVIVAGDGSVVGHGSTETIETARGREIVQDQELLLAGDVGASMRVKDRSIVRLDAAGLPLSITSTSQSGGRTSRSEAQVAQGKVTVTQQAGGGRRLLVIPISSAVRFDAGTELIATWNPALAPKLEFEQFNTGAMRVERVVLEPAPSLASDPSGVRPVIRRRYESDSLIGLSRLLLDERGAIIAATQPMFGSSVTIRTVDRKTALAPHRPYRVLNHVMVKSPFRIPETAAKGRIRYRFTFRDGLTFTPPQTGEQRVVVESGAVTLDICQACGPGLAADEQGLADALKATIWLQSDHPKLKAIAARAAGKGSDADKMELLTRDARSRIRTIDFRGHYSALETLSRATGDCTESAVLLAALGRAAGIPTRVVNGLVYSRERYHGVAHVFMPHSWVLAYVDGRWRSYDAALELFDSTHIALNIGDGDERSIATAGQLASLLTWESMTEVKMRPAN